MQYTSILALLAAAGTSIAAPAPAPATNMMATDVQWTMGDMLRTCSEEGTTCNYSFSVNTNDGSAPTSCAYAVNGNPAAHAAYSNVGCGAFTIGSTWDPSGFQVLSVVKDGLIIYPGYTDAQLANGQVVKPDMSYTPAKLPGTK